MSIAVDVRVAAVDTVVDRYHALRVTEVVERTPDAISIVFDIPADLADSFAYAAGQFVTLRLDIDGERLFRSYSMSSSPAVDEDLEVTVKRVPGGVVSNWLHDSVRPGDTFDVSSPTGVFVLHDDDGDLVAFAAGSGITPVFSLITTALHTTSRNVRLLFANRERSAAIFGDDLDGLAESFPGRLTVVHHEDVHAGFLTSADIARFLGESGAGVNYLCGPGPFMDLVEASLREHGVADERIHLERFTPVSVTPDDDVDIDAGSATGEVVVTIGRETTTIVQRGDATILQSARWAGLRAPASCEAGHCATCMARVVEGRVLMATNEILTPDEVSDGWVLTCQAVPTSPVVRVLYE